MARATRLLVVTLAAVAAAAAMPRRARAQEVECDPGDREVRSLDFTGNKSFKDSELALRVNTTPSTWTRRHLRIFGAKRCTNAELLGSDIVALREFYRRKGFINATVDTVIAPAGREQIRVTFAIDEGPAVHIASATITGLDSVRNRAAVLRGLYIAPGKVYDEFRIRADYDTIIQRLRNSGYPRADVLPNRYLNRVALTAELTPEVITGPHSRFDSILVHVTPAEGKKQQISDKTVKDLLGIKRGEVYRDDDITEGQRNLYRTGGYLHVDVQGDTVANADSLVKLNVLLVEDYMHQLDTEVGWATLDCFRTRATYTNKNVFKSARRLELTGQLSKIGIGYPLSTPATENLCYGKLRADPFSDTTNYYVGATIRQQALFGTGAVPALSIYRERHGEYLAYLRSIRIGGELSAVKNLGTQPTPLRVAYTLENGRTDAQPALLCAVFRRCTQEERAQITGVYRRLAVASIGLGRIRTDNDVSPTTGTVLRGEFRTSQPQIWSDDSVSFNKWTLDGAWYHALGRGNVAALRLRGGALYGGQGTASGARLVPPQERLYAGGATSVRGFQQNELGEASYLLQQSKVDSLVIHDPITSDSAQYYYTRDSTQYDRVVPAGGNTLLVSNAEIRLRSAFFPDVLQYALFLDGGSVWTRAGSTQGFKFYWTPGVGARVFSPFGPIVINVGYNPYNRPIGAAFFAPNPDSAGFAPLYCTVPVTGLSNPNDPANRAELERQLVEKGVPAKFDPAFVGGQPIGRRWQQPPNTNCKPQFNPQQKHSFLSKLTLTFSIGPDF